MDLREVVNGTDWHEETALDDRFNLSKDMRMFNLAPYLIVVNYFLVDAMVLVNPVSFLYAAVNHDANGFIAIGTSIGLASSVSPPPSPIPLVVSRGPDSKCFPACVTLLSSSIVSSYLMLICR